MDNYTIFKMFENPTRCRQARNFTTNAPKIKDLKLSSEQIIFPKLTLGAPESSPDSYSVKTNQENMIFMAKKKNYTHVAIQVQAFRRKTNTEGLDRQYYGH